MKQLLLLAVILLTNTFIGYSQNDTELKRQAKAFFAYNRYDDALKTLQRSRNLTRTDEEGRFLISLCLYHLNRLDEAADILDQLVANEKTPYPECWFYLGKIYHARHQFVEAGRFYKAYLKNISPNDPKRRMVTDIIRRTANGQQYQYKPSEAFVENLGRQVNTPYDEFAPVPSLVHDDRLYFSSAREGSTGGKRNRQGLPDERFGQYFSDMYYCSILKGIWGGVQPMPYQLNSPQHDMLLDFNKDGTALIYFKGLEFNSGDILVDTFRQMDNRILSSDPFLSPMDARRGDCCPFLYNDTLLFFASRRPGGYGGLDLYKTALRNGRWTNPENLGPTINTPYDETTPFLARDGRTLYFSSNHPERSIGGLDVLRSVYAARLNIWTEPRNLGLPINSAADDEYFRLARDGFTAFFASSRKDGFGQRDLYIAYFNNYLSEMEPPAVEYVQAPKPTARIQTTPDFPENPPLQPETRPIPPTPTSASTLPANVLFLNTEKDLTPDQLAPWVQQLRANPDRQLVLTVYALDTRGGSRALFQAISYAERAAQMLDRQGVPRASMFMRGAIATQVPSGQKNNFAIVFDLHGGEQLAAKGPAADAFDPALHEGLVYKVQIAALKGEYNGPLLFDYPHPMVEKTLDFEYHRYTVGATHTFAEALKLQNELKAKGRSGAHIAVYINGHRKEYKELSSYASTFPDLRNYLRR
ncbi:MAG TPA: hypothetical protein PKC76_10020 [Saprospiraceae bacterium]|nr:hypothetical protein [Saprospiraceae bacterium]HMP24458.1 hypothetical protein [Saprospiraceae bacterium]